MNPSDDYLDACRPPTHSPRELARINTYFAERGVLPPIKCAYLPGDLGSPPSYHVRFNLRTGLLELN